MASSVVFTMVALAASARAEVSQARTEIEPSGNGLVAFRDFKRYVTPEDHPVAKHPQQQQQVEVGRNRSSVESEDTASAPGFTRAATGTTGIVEQKTATATPGTRPKLDVGFATNAVTPRRLTAALSILGDLGEGALQWAIGKACDFVLQNGLTMVGQEISEFAKFMINLEDGDLTNAGKHLANAVFGGPPDEIGKRSFGNGLAQDLSLLLHAGNALDSTAKRELQDMTQNVLGVDTVAQGEDLMKWVGNGVHRGYMGKHTVPALIEAAKRHNLNDWIDEGAKILAPAASKVVEDASKVVEDVRVAICSVGGCIGDGLNRWAPALRCKVCCDGFVECNEPAWKSDEDYCSPNDPQHGLTCWSEAVMCRAPSNCHYRANSVLTPPADVRPMDTRSFISTSDSWTEHQETDCFSGQNAWDLVGKPATCKEVCAQRSDCAAVVFWSDMCFFRNQADCGSNLKFAEGHTVYLRQHPPLRRAAVYGMPSWPSWPMRRGGSQSKNVSDEPLTWTRKTVHLRQHPEMIEKASVRLGNIIAGERSTPGALAFATITCVVVGLGGGVAITLRIMHGRVRDDRDNFDPLRNQLPYPN